jgi:cyclopropane-fatty-acyl-phospholipid synthase
MPKQFATGGRFNANKERIKTICDEHFCRMWKFYLASSEVSFRFLEMTVFQIQIVKKSGLLPLKRDYIEKLENEM